ncbi:MAG: hypothetical protein PHV07_03990 [Oscillospiraceae bacterium]|nr:hypothetical protein [Oscillospiraceae bacterium]
MSVWERIWLALVYAVKSVFMKKILIIALNILFLGLGFAISGNLRKAIYSYVAMFVVYSLFILSGFGIPSITTIMFFIVVAVYFYNVIYPLFLETIVFRKIFLMSLATLTMISLFAAYVIFARLFIYDIFQYQNNFGDKVKKGEVVFAYKFMPKPLPEIILIEKGGYTYLTTTTKAKYYQVNLTEAYRGYPVYILWSRDSKRTGKFIQ